MEILCPTVGNYYLEKVNSFSATVSVCHACIDTTNTETKKSLNLWSNMWIFAEQCLSHPGILARIHVLSLPIHNQDGETFPYVFLHQKFRSCSSFLKKKKLNTKKDVFVIFCFYMVLCRREHGPQKEFDWMEWLGTLFCSDLKAGLKNSCL